MSAHDPKRTFRAWEDPQSRSIFGHCRQKGCTVSSRYNKKACDCHADGSSHTLHSPERASGCVIPAGSLHYVSRHERYKSHPRHIVAGAM
jgi:hypothetical protein